MKKSVLLIGLLLPTLGIGQQYSIDWYKVSGGGVLTDGAADGITAAGAGAACGTITGGNYSLNPCGYTAAVRQAWFLPDTSVKPIVLQR